MQVLMDILLGLALVSTVSSLASADCEQEIDVRRSSLRVRVGKSGLFTLSGGGTVLAHDDPYLHLLQATGTYRF